MSLFSLPAHQFWNFCLDQGGGYCSAKSLHTILDSTVESPFGLLSCAIKSCLFIGALGLEVTICDLKSLNY
jgi:hypothetical protein